MNCTRELNNVLMYFTSILKTTGFLQLNILLCITLFSVEDDTFIWDIQCNLLINSLRNASYESHLSRKCSSTSTKPETHARQIRLCVRVLVTFHLMCIHIIFNSVSVAE